MTYSETLAARVRRVLSDRDDVAERPMFGGLTFMVGGHMCCGVNKDELIVRLRPADIDSALSRPHARPMDLTGRPMRGFVTVAPEGQKGLALRRWIALALANATELPTNKPTRKEQPPKRARSGSLTRSASTYPLPRCGWRSRIQPRMRAGTRS
jgi:TfoX/Sxy family transcriptional regulator of competence genes